VEEGLSNPEIGAKLMLSRRTVGTHVSHILKKLDVNSRTDIARESALRRRVGVVPPREAQEDAAGTASRQGVTSSPASPRLDALRAASGRRRG
jgi:hypothetical protein